MIKQKPLIAIVGCGRHMSITLAPYLQHFISHCQFIPFDRNESRARTIANFLGAPQISTNIDHLIAKGVNAAIICLPGDCSLSVTRRFVELKKPVFLEKPGAQYSQDIAELKKKFGDDTCDTLVQIGFNFRYAEVLRNMHSLAYEGGAHVFNLSFLSKHPSGSEWGIDSNVEAWLRHNGVHAIDLAIHFMGHITRIQSSIVYHANDRFLISALCFHDNSNTTLLTLGNNTQSFHLSASLITENGSLIHNNGLSELQLSSPENSSYSKCVISQKCMDMGWSRQGYGPEIKNFIEHVITQDKKPTPNLSDAQSALESCEMLLEGINAQQVN